MPSSEIMDPNKRVTQIIINEGRHDIDAVPITAKARITRKRPGSPRSPNLALRGRLQKKTQTEQVNDPVPSNRAQAAGTSQSQDIVSARSGDPWKYYEPVLTCLRA